MKCVVTFTFVQTFFLRAKSSHFNRNPCDQEFCVMLLGLKVYFLLNSASYITTLLTIDNQLFCSAL